MVLVKNLKIFSSFYCRLNRPKKAFLDSKMCLRIFYEGKKHFQTLKSKS